MNADQLCLNDVLLAYRLNLREVERRHGQHDADAMRSLDHVRVGHDVAVGIHNHAGTDCMLPRDQGGLTAIAFFDWSIAGNENLNHRR